MKRKYALAIFTLVFGLIYTSNFNVNFPKQNQSLNIQKVNNPSVRATDTTITILDMALYLNTKKEHYPFSDEFIEKYQQTSGGYIDFANKTGHLVDREKHEPNQKWHFFDSWLMQSIEDGTLTWDADAKRRVYSGLLCPELLLWIFEATEVSPDKVKNAKEVAEQGKVANTNVSTIAKNMRACVPWEDIQNTISTYKGTNA